jgi:hypothetical protein
VSRVSNRKAEAGLLSLHCTELANHHLGHKGLFLQSQGSKLLRCLLHTNARSEQNGHGDQEKDIPLCCIQLRVFVFIVLCAPQSAEAESLPKTATVGVLKVNYVKALDEDQNGLPEEN